MGVYRCSNLVRFRRKLTLIVLGIILVGLIAAYTRHVVYKPNEPYKGQTRLDLNRARDVGGAVMSKFNFTILNRLTSLINYNQYNEEHGYVVALSFSGQQGAGIQALMSLQCWAASFKLPIRILEPVINNTIFVSAPHEMSTSLSNAPLRFSDLFDIQHFNRISEFLGYAPVGTREDFFAFAPREVIYVDLKSVPKSTPMSQRMARIVWTVDSEPEGEEHCYHFENSSGTLKQLAYLKDSFCVVRIIEATHSLAYHYIFSDKEVRAVIYGDRQPWHVTVIFSVWRTPWYVANNELDIPLQCKHAGHDSSKTQFLPSPRLISDAKYYEKHFLNASNEVALMLRIEHMIEYVDHNQEKWTVDKCLSEAYRLTKERLRIGKPMVTLDMGKFGSGVWGMLATKRGVDVDGLTWKSKLLLNSLFDNEWTFEEWEESFTLATDGKENSGYIAALQRTLASRAKCLVLVGGGTFQDLALKDYLRNHPRREDQCVQLICVKNKESFMKVING